MRTLLLALPLATLMMLAGCSESDSQAAGFTSPSSGTTASAPAAPAPAPQPAATARRSTTQPLPSGNSYIHEQDLTGGRLVSGGTTTAQTTAQRSGS